MSAIIPVRDGFRVDAEPKRDVWTAMRRGFSGRCPQCGEGALFRAFLKVADDCSVCHEPLHHQRADDAPPYVTILIVAHVIGALILLADELVPDLPLWIHMTAWPILTVGLSLLLLPRIKGALIGLQWALRMHGFAGDESETSALRFGA